MSQGKATRHLHCSRDERLRDWAHGDDQRSRESPGRPARLIGDIHRDVLSLLKMPDRNTCPLKPSIEREATAQQKADQIVPPYLKEIGHLLLQLATSVNPVSRQIGLQVRLRGSGLGLRITRIGDL
jgi:hypothetical protein